MSDELNQRYLKIVRGLTERTVLNEIEWEKSDSWGTSEGFDASLARSSFQLRVGKNGQFKLGVVDDQGETVVTLTSTPENESDPVTRLYQTVKDRENVRVLERLDNVIADIAAAEEPPF